MQNSNTWLAVYERKINELIFQLERHSMMNTAGGVLNLKIICAYLKGAVNEIKKVEEENIQLKNKLKDLYKKHNIKDKEK